MNEEPRLASNAQAPHPRAVGSPLPRGSLRSQEYSSAPEKQLATQDRPLPEPPRGASHPASGVQRAVNVVRSVVPIVQKLLPLLDGNVVTAVSNVLTAPQHKPMPPLDLTPLQEGVTELQLQQRKLRDQVADQHTSLKRVEGQLERVREATDRNTLEQQELIVDLKKTGKKVNLVAWIALVMLLVSVLLNLALFLRVEHILH